MNATEFTESKYLNAKTSGVYNGTTQTIFDVKAEMVGRENNLKRKMIIGFEGIEKGFVCNPTNNLVLVEAFGEETDNWIGKKVIFHIVRVPFEGRQVPSLQLEPVTQTTVTESATEPAPQKKVKK
jgi:hypothetical protein